jgi:lipase chaperone LimK
VARLVRAGPANCAIRNRTRGARIEASQVYRQYVPWYWEAAEIYRKLKRHGDEIALIRRFANNHNIHFRAFSKRYRSTRATTYDWATTFLERIDVARSAAANAEKEDDQS